MIETTPSSIDASLARSPELLNRGRSHLLIVDVQTKLLPVIQNSAAVEETIIFLMNAAGILKVPVFVSEQYPRGLGPTVASIADHPVEKQVAEKLRFSAAECFSNRTAPEEYADIATRRDQIVVVGIEAHICVLQTAFDLLSLGLRVYVVSDAVGSRSPSDQATALDRIRDAGGVVCSAESVAFEWCEAAGTEEFKQISRLVRDRESNRPLDSART